MNKKRIIIAIVVILMLGISFMLGYFLKSAYVVNELNELCEYYYDDYNYDEEDEEYEEKEKMLEQKYNLIEESAIMWGEDNKDSIFTSYNTKTYNGYSCITIKVKDLVPNYLDADSNNCELGTNCILDPSDVKRFLDNVNVVVYYNNERIFANAAVYGCV